MKFHARSILPTVDSRRKHYTQVTCVMQPSEKAVRLSFAVSASDLRSDCNL